MRLRSWPVWLALATLVGAGGCESVAVTPRADASMDAGIDVESPCATGQARCDGRCVDIEVNREHCGACGRACPGAQVCAAGTCRTACPSGQAVCNGACATLATDNANCGACGTACPAGQVCASGRCALTCGASLAECASAQGADGGAARACADLTSDRLNCGACGNRCGAGELCVNRACTISCPAGQTVCGGRCVTTANDPANCGACGTACAAGQVCTNGACATSCPAGQSVCGASCVTLGTDRANCGACGTTCASGQVCVDGACATTCPAGQVDCGGRCVTTATDNANCGACGTTCDTGLVCSAGACTLRCAAPLTECGTGGARTCADLRGDRANCGACGSACASGQVCNAGRCEISCPAAQTACANICVSAATDPANCGACGNRCGAGEVCASGSCVTSCPTGQAACSGVCVVLNTDRANCGACGRGCAPGEVCSNGTCTVGCASPLSECARGGARFCANLDTDRTNCGACGVACATGQACDAGVCVTSCPSGQEICGSACVTLSIDSANCGGCGVVCASGERCVSGRCQVSCPSGQTSCSSVCVSTATDTRHCGACGAACAARANASGRCASGACAYTCNDPFGDCNGQAGDGCEVDTSRSTAHCGACNNACPARANAAAACNAGTCGFVCNAGFADCDGDASNGCEVDLATSAANCGRCARACPSRANAAAACVDGQCDLTCATNFANCDGAPTNGCEVDTRVTASHCGACGNACPSGANSSPTCAASSCGIACAANFGNCDGNASNGCEVDTRVTDAHCGACGNACTGPARCVASACTACTLPAQGALTIPSGGMVTSVTGTLPAVAGQVTSQFSTHTCRTVAGGAEHIYSFTVTAPTPLQIYTTGTTDPTLAIRANCTDGATEVACDDDGGASLNAYVRRVFAPGTYYVIVDSNSTSTLAYTLNLALWTAASNPTCGTATTLTEGAPVTGQNPAGGGDRTTLCQSTAESGQLYYAMTVPSGRRATVTLTQTSSVARTLALRLLDGCPTTLCVSSLSTTSLTAQTLSVDNATSTPRTYYLGVSTGDMATVDATFSLGWTSTALPYVVNATTAACDDMTGGATVTMTSTTSDDTNSAIAALPFTLPFFNATASHYSVSTNGLMQLWSASSGSPSSPYSNAAMSTAPNGTVAPFWDDLGFPSGQSYGVVAREITDTLGRRFVVQWTNYADYSALTARLTFQVKLFQTGAIEIHYCSMTNSNTASSRHLGDSATVGMRSIDGANNVQVGLNTAGLTRPGTAYALTIP